MTHAIQSTFELDRTNNAVIFRHVLINGGYYAVRVERPNAPLPQQLFIDPQGLLAIHECFRSIFSAKPPVGSHVFQHSSDGTCVARSLSTRQVTQAGPAVARQFTEINRLLSPQRAVTFTAAPQTFLSAQASPPPPQMKTPPSPSSPKKRAPSPPKPTLPRQKPSQQTPAPSAPSAPPVATPQPAVTPKHPLTDQGFIDLLGKEYRQIYDYIQFRHKHGCHPDGDPAYYVSLTNFLKGIKDSHHDQIIKDLQNWTKIAHQHYFSKLPPQQEIDPQLIAASWVMFRLAEHHPDQQAISRRLDALAEQATGLKMPS